MEIDLPRGVIGKTRREVIAEATPNCYRWMRNFHSYFPNSGFPEGSYVKMLFATVGCLDILMRAWYERREMNFDPTDPDSPSPLYLGQTGREFLQTVDDVIAYYNVDTDLVRSLIRNNRFGVKVMNRVGRMIFPVFVHLRALGYGNYELRS